MGRFLRKIRIFLDRALSAGCFQAILQLFHSLNEGIDPLGQAEEFRILL